MSNAYILAIDDDKDILATLEVLLENKGFHSAARREEEDFLKQRYFEYTA